MSWLKENKVFIFLIFVNLLFILTIVKISYKIQQFNYFYVSIFLLVGILMYWLCHTFLKRKGLKFIFIVVILAVGAIFYYFNSAYVIRFVNEQLINNLIYINSQVSTESPTSFLSFKPILVILLPLITFIITFLTSKGLANSILILSFSLITTLWYLGYTEEIKAYLFYYILVTLITYCMNGHIKNVKKLSKKGIKVNIDSKKVFMYTIIICIVIAEITEYMPQEFNGKYSAVIKSRFINKYVQNAESDEDKGKKLKYDLSLSGYDRNTKKLGGPISVNKSVAFKVKSDGVFYLKGSVKDYYDGFSWSQSDIKYNAQNEKDKSMFQDNFSKGFMNTSKAITVYPQGLNSSTLFIPTFAYNADLESGNVYYDDIPTFLTGSAVHKPYNIDFYDLTEEGLNVYSNGINKDKKEVGVLYYADNYKKYLQIPNNLSPRIYDLVYSLTKDKKYNYEKVQAIKDYLNTSFKYTLKVSDVPNGQEFLDYFLFTEKKGYCTYFATAETIMCRIAGIPARYVEGFNMTSDKDKTGLYEVKNENAHAWTEVLYMETPFIGLWYTVDAVPNAVDYIHKEEEGSKLNSDNGSSTNGTGITVPGKKANEDTGADGTLIVKKTISPALIRIIYSVSSLIILNILMVLIYLIRKRNILNKSSIIPLYKYSLERLESIGIKKSQYMSDMEFIDTLEKGLTEKVNEVAKFSYSEYFGGKVPQKFNKKEYYQFIEDYIKKRQNIFVYFIKKYYYFKKISLIKTQIMVLYKKIRRS